MTTVEFMLVSILVYGVIGIFIGLRFVLSTIRVIDPVASQASLKVRLFFLPGAVALWPIVLRHSHKLRTSGSEPST